MLDKPKTLEEARKIKYGLAIFGKKPYQEGHCVYEVAEQGRGFHWWQCRFKNGKGPGGLYCGIHAKMVKP